MILNPMSLVNTIDLVNERFLFGIPIAQEEGLEAARWIATRQGEKGAYRGSFAPTPLDFEQGMHLFTGEKVAYAAARHILGQEAARLVWLLGRSDPALRTVYERATRWMETSDFQQTGSFCCGRCTLAYWRHFWVGDFEHKAELISKGLQTMKAHRQGDGQWRRYPFYYAVYALLGLDLDPARDELRYARPRMERLLVTMRTSVYSARKSAVLRQALALVS